jgi:hypothetical protein
MGDSMILITLKQALEALESRDGTLFDDELAAITALRQAIEQVEQAPICAHGVSKLKCDFCKQPEQAQPVAWMGAHDKTDLYYRKPPQADVIPLYTAPPQRKPLTPPQIHELDWPDGVAFEEILMFVRAIEAKLREKNT